MEEDYVYSNPNAEPIVDKIVVKKSSRLWYLVPIFLGIIGGLIGYFVLKDRDKKIANRMLIIGLVVLIVDIFIIFLMPMIAYTIVSNDFKELSSNSTNTIRDVGYGISTAFSIVDARNVQDNVNVVMRNIGAKDMSTNGISVTIDGVSKNVAGVSSTVFIGQVVAFRVTDAANSCGKTLSIEIAGISQQATITC
jgi:hypothetical protein